MLEYNTTGHPLTFEIGVDEVGRGCLCGPVLAAAVVLPEPAQIEHPLYKDRWNQVKDSKKLSEKKRAELSAFIKEQCIYGFGWMSATEIDRLNILQATMRAMHLALDNCFRDSKWDTFPIGRRRVQIRIDGNHFRPYVPPGEDTEDRWSLAPECVVNGDNTYLAIAAASVIAKEERDTYMKQLVETEPLLRVYGITKNKGYGTKVHLDALRTHGATAHHRQSFRPVKEASDSYED